MRRTEMAKASDGKISLRSRCSLLSLNRSSIYYEKADPSADVATLMNEIQDIYKERPFQGYKRITRN